MSLYFKGIPLQDIIDGKSIEASLETEFIALDTKVAFLKELQELTGDEVGLEGVLWDTVKAVNTVNKETAKAAKAGYKKLKNTHSRGKEKWNKTIKPLIVKTIKEIGAILQNIYIKFSNMDKRYQELGKNIDIILNHKLKQVGSINQLYVPLHDFNPHVLKGYTEIIGDFEAYYNSVLESSSKNYKPPKEIIAAIKRKNLNVIKTSSDALTQCIENSNRYGDVTIPWLIYKHNRYNSFFKTITEREPSKEIMKSSLSDFVKGTILGNEVEMKFDQYGDRDKFIKGAGSYLKLMSSILNNKVLDKALKDGGTSIKKLTKDIYKEIEEINKIEIPIPSGSNNKEDEDNSNESKNVSEEDLINREVEAYTQNSITLISKLSTAYTGIVRGSLSALFILVGESERLVSTIEASIGASDKK